jgi:hypothetical protein
MFAYYYHLPIIAARPWPDAHNHVEVGLNYFCFVVPDVQRSQVSFPWEEIGAISVDRNHHATPERVVVVGRRLPQP